MDYQVKFRTILADPPWPQAMHNLARRAGGKMVSDGTKSRAALQYQTMTVAEICELPVAGLADEACHLWLWTTNEFLEAGFQVMRAWGFNYLAPIHWIYRLKCVFPMARFRPNIIETAKPNRHSVKPDQSYAYIESISPGPRLELFAREYGPLFPKREGWNVWGNEVESDITFP